MKALQATIKILLDPRVLGPECDDPNWRDQSDATACDYVSEVLTFQQAETVLDWAYIRQPGNDSPLDFGWETVEIGDPSEYEEGQFLALHAGDDLVSIIDRHFPRGSA